MTKEEIIEMAEKAGYIDLPLVTKSMELKELRTFAKLVAEKAIEEALETKDEPVAWYCKEGLKRGVSLKQESPEWTPLYTTPQRTWVGLTKMELVKCGVFPWGNSYQLYQAIESKLKEKNT